MSLPCRWRFSNQPEQKPWRIMRRYQLNPLAGPQVLLLVPLGGLAAGRGMDSGGLILPPFLPPPQFFAHPPEAKISAQHCIKQRLISLQVGGDAAHVIEVFKGIEHAQAAAQGV